MCFRHQRVFSFNSEENPSKAQNAMKFIENEETSLQGKAVVALTRWDRSSWVLVSVSKGFFKVKGQKSGPSLQDRRG
jgi:hypothetical protein